MSIRAVGGMFLFIAALIIAAVLRTGPTLLDWLALAPPFITLWGVWTSLRTVTKTSFLLEKNAKQEDERAFDRMRQHLNIMAGEALFCMLLSVFAGLTIGHATAHLPLWLHK
ncbi:hypothetical protein HNQ77_004091 [Silvibacterium bohemicum]|uniref:Uncharacterized protein n=1 Tax=Silvibacterium bohemicum TaxID=1577686 RepID=A0A841K4P8_9BACT|nr:hypothetical protein [Silvibacterium bohemicum]MBB6146121.1 hypothetical protein [Silvibacterium bohemicum]